MNDTRPHAVARIDAERCCGCTQCRLVCPAAAIALRLSRCVVEPERCTGCAKCRWACPIRCIAVEGTGDR